MFHPRLSTLKKHIFPRFCSPSVVPGLNDLLLLWGFRSAEQPLVSRELSSSVFFGSEETHGATEFVGEFQTQIVKGIPMTDPYVWYIC